jgi:chromate transporter
MSRAQFLDLVGACNLLPGPSSTQVSMVLGYRRAGWPGLAASGLCFILPSILSTLALAWAYVRFGSLPQAQGLFYGAKPVMLAIIVQAIWNLGRTAYRRWQLALAGLACFAAVLAGAQPIAVLLVAGSLALLAVWLQSRRKKVKVFAFLPSGLGIGSASGIAAAGSTTAVGLLPIFFVFLKLGVVVFGSGYVLLAFFKADLVDRLHWITNAQLIDSVTAGQITPGPVFATATFLGYLLHGFAGAAVATAAIFLPSFLLAGLVGALAEHIRKSPLAAAFLDGVNAAAVALMASVALALGRAVLVDSWTWGFALVSVVLMIRFRVNATWLILAGAALGILLRGLG